MDFVRVCDKEICTGLGGKVKNVIYSLCKSVVDKKTIFGIKIDTQHSNQTSSCILGNISSDEKLVLNIINCLIQNGVDDICMFDVVKDLMYTV